MLEIKTNVNSFLRVFFLLACCGYIYGMELYTTHNTGGLSVVSSLKDCQSGLPAILNINVF
jgi:hypothetical protein